jgi:hypothetical protein
LSTQLAFKADLKSRLLVENPTLNLLYDDLQLRFHKSQKILKRLIMGYTNVDLKDALDYIEGMEMVLDELYGKFTQEIKEVGPKVDALEPSIFDGIV